MKNETMKPCPFCGIEDTTVEIEKSGFGTNARVSCEICGGSAWGIGVMSGPVIEAELFATAIAAWNTRPLPDAVREAVALLSSAMPSTLHLGPPDDCPEPFLHLDPYGMIALRTILDYLKETNDEE
ncbi:MAG: Lar family restriction alleviation protein [Nannocystaceae bacterium]